VFKFIYKIFRLGSEDPVIGNGPDDSGPGDDAPVVSQSLPVEADVVDPPCFREVVKISFYWII
jgi:hypothetical protein